MNCTFSARQSELESVLEPEQNEEKSEWNKWQNMFFAWIYVQDWDN